MSTWSGRALAAAAWVAVVAVGAVVVWTVISRAGAGLVSESAPVTTGTVRPEAVSTAGSTGTTEEQRATWEDEVGVVTAACRGPAVSLVGAQPEEDRVVQLLDRGPDRLVVAFRETGRETVTVTVRCQAGRPDFSVSRTPTSTVSPGSPVPPSPTPSETGGDDGGSDDGPEG